MKRRKRMAMWLDSIGTSCWETVSRTLQWLSRSSQSTKAAMASGRHFEMASLLRRWEPYGYGAGRTMKEGWGSALEPPHLASLGTPPDSGGVSAPTVGRG